MDVDEGEGLGEGRWNREDKEDCGILWWEVEKRMNEKRERMEKRENIGVEEKDKILRMEERFGEREEEISLIEEIVCLM